MTTIDTQLGIESWDEKPYRELDDGSKFTRADVKLGAGGGIESAALESTMYYRADGTSSYVSFMYVTATLEDKSGTFVLQGSGTYADETATVDLEIVPNSGTGDLTTIKGSAQSISTRADYPNMPLVLTYEIE